MDDRISKNIHRELRTMNGKLDEMGVVSRILTDSIKEQTAEMKRNARRKTPKIGGLALASAASSASASASSESNLLSKMNMMITSLQKQVTSLSITNSPTISISANVDSSTSNEVTIENTNEIAVSIAQQLSSSLSQQLATTFASFQSQSMSALVQVSTTINGKSGKKAEDKSKSIMDYIRSGQDFLYNLNDEVTKIRDAKENGKLVKEFFQGEKAGKDGDSKCCCNGGSGGTDGGEGSDMSVTDDTSDEKKEERKKDKGKNKRLGQAKYGKRRANKTISRSKSKNFKRTTYKKKNDFKELGRAAQGQNRDVGSSPNKDLGQAMNTGQKSSSSAGPNAQQDLGKAASGTSGQGQGTPQNSSKAGSGKSGTGYGQKSRGGMLGKAKKFGKWGLFGAAVGSISMRLFGGEKKEEEEGNSDSTTVQTTAVLQSTAETIQSVQSAVEPMADAAKAASTASDVSKAASATKKVGWLGKLIKGARTVSKATRFLRWNPAGFIGGLAVDAGLWAAEKLFLPKEDEEKVKEEEEEKQVRPMVRSNLFAKNRALAASTVSSSVQAYSANSSSMQTLAGSVPSGAGTTDPSMPTSQTPNMPRVGGAAGSMEVSTNSNVTMNLNVNGYIDNRMIEEIKRIAREQYDASFRAFERSIADKLPKPKPIPRPQVAEGGMMSY